MTCRGTNRTHCRLNRTSEAVARQPLQPAAARSPTKEATDHRQQRCNDHARAAPQERPAPTIPVMHQPQKPRPLQKTWTAAKDPHRYQDGQHAKPGLCRLPTVGAAKTAQTGHQSGEPRPERSVQFSQQLQNGTKTHSMPQRQNEHQWHESQSGLAAAIQAHRVAEAAPNAALNGTGCYFRCPQCSPQSEPTLPCPAPHPKQK
mmetsp:Transcript_26687/g.58842  ORF Transcript_26687/g.58842 Transcript_26687/m.58842 type:complete len:203 (+) Transcript_26687:2537-3145(+)